MSRKRSAKIRTIEPDVVYNSVMLGKFINMVMWNGKKSVAQKIVYSALDQVAKKTKMKQKEVFEKVMSELSPVVEVKSRRVGGATYSVPTDIRPVRKRFLAMGWLIRAARNRAGTNMARKLAAEMEDVLNERGGAVKKKVDVHKAAEASKAFSHLRF